MAPIIIKYVIGNYMVHNIQLALCSCRFCTWSWLNLQMQNPWVVLRWLCFINRNKVNTDSTKLLLYI